MSINFISMSKSARSAWISWRNWLNSSNKTSQIKKEMPRDTKKYLLRGIDPDRWIEIKHFCLDEGITMKEFILSAIDFFIENQNITKSD